MNDIVKTSGVEKLPAALDSRVVVEKLNEIRKVQGQVDKLHLTFLRDLDVEIEKLLKEKGNTDMYSSINIKVFTNPNGTRSHIMMCEDTADMMLSRESPSVRIAMKRELRKALSQPKLPSTYAEALLEAGRLALALEQSEKDKMKALQQADYQNKALSTSQVRNGLKTKENAKLRAQIRGYVNNYVSIAQYVAREKINIKGIYTNTIVIQLKTVAKEDEVIKQTIKDDKFSSVCFSLDFLDNHRENILVMIEFLKEGKPLAKYFTFN